jgi:hypothetical protein
MSTHQASLDAAIRDAVDLFFNGRRPEPGSTAEPEPDHLVFLRRELNNNLGAAGFLGRALRQDRRAPESPEEVLDLDHAEEAVGSTTDRVRRLMDRPSLHPWRAPLRVDPAAMRQVADDIVGQFLADAVQRCLSAERVRDEAVQSACDLIAFVLEEPVGDGWGYARPGAAPPQLEQVFGVILRGRPRGYEGVALSLAIASEAARAAGAELTAGGRTRPGQLPPEPLGTMGHYAQQG